MKYKDKNIEIVNWYNSVKTYKNIFLRDGF